ncbi:hypothetical protein JYT12_00030 [Beggiatoa alba]|nr:hypothetical protein [Beggiatoa alba]
MYKRFALYLFDLLATSLSQPLFAHDLVGELSGFTALEYRYFPQAAMTLQQNSANFSLALQPEYYHSWDNGDQSITITPFLRLDQNDSELYARRYSRAAIPNRVR